MIGKHVGRYRIEELLGVGGMGEVFRAWDRERNVYVALKRLPPEAANDEALRRRFRREAEASAKLDHPAVAQFHEFLEDKSGCWLAMEYVEGTSLADLIEYHGALSVERVVELARQIAEGLQAAHEKEIIHRDLKTENVLVDRDGRARILDFGLAKHLFREESGGTLTQDGMMVGTCRTMSPEQALGEPVDARSDLFSLGVLLYETLTGTSPFTAATPLETIALVISQPHPPILGRNPRIPRQLAELVDALLRKEPKDRPQSAEEVLRRLDEIPRFLSWGARLSRHGTAPQILLYVAIGLATAGGVFLISRSGGLLEEAAPAGETPSQEIRLSPAASPDRVPSPAVQVLAEIAFKDFLNGRFARAAEGYVDAMDLFQETPDLLLALADAKLASGDAEAADKLYTRVLDLSTEPETWQDQAVLARALAQAGRSAEAVEAAHEVLRLAPQDPWAAYEAAVAFAVAGDPEAAVEAAETALAGGVKPRWLESPWLEALQGELGLVPDELGHEEP